MSLTVCIEIDDDGQITVGTEPDEAEQGGQQSGGMPGAQPMQGQGEESEDANMRSVKSIDEALQVAGDLLRNAPQVQDAEGQKGFASVFEQPKPKGM